MRQLAIRAALVGAVLACGMFAAPAFAGLHYTSVTETTPPQGKAQTLRAEGWVDGDKAKVAFTESGNPMLGEGNYLLTTDGGKTLVLVNPKEKTYAPFDLSQMMGAAGAMLKGMGSMVKMSFTNQKVEKLVEEPGPAILGYDTTHYRFKTSYDSEIKVMGMGNSSHHETIGDTWTTPKLTDGGLHAWLRREPPRTGIADLDQMIANDMKKGITGVPLKMSSVTTSTDQKGRETKSSTTMEVTSMKTEAVPAATFEIPAGYGETQLAPAAPPAH
jgi:hypothetical protein